MYTTSPIRPAPGLLRSPLGGWLSWTYAAWGVLTLGMMLSVLAGGLTQQWAVERSIEAGGLVAWAVFGGGLVASLLMAGLVASLTMLRNRAMNMAEAMTLQLRQKEISLSEVQHMAQLGNWSYDFDRQRVQGSEVAGLLLGQAPDGLAAGYADCLRRVHCADRRLIQDLVRAATLRGQGFETELRARDRDGRWRWLSLLALPMVNEDAQVRLVRGTVMDVTARKSAELRRALEDKVARLLAEADSQAAVMPGILEAVCKILGWDCGSRWNWDAGQDSLACLETWTVDNPGPRKYLAAIRQGVPGLSARSLLRRVVNSARTACIPDLAGEPDAALAPLARRYGLHGVVAFPILADEKVLGAMAFFSRDACDMDEDLSEVLQTIGMQIGQFCRQLEEDAAADKARRNLEGRLQGIVSAANEAIILVNESFHIDLFNPAAQVMFGYSAQQAIGRSLEMVIPGRLHDVHRHPVQRFASGATGNRKMGEKMDVLGLRANGQEFPLEASISRIVDAGEPLYSVILNDITDRKNHEQQLKFLANYDALTNLPNRSLFHQRLERGLAYAQRFNKGLALLFMDVDRFKNINDTLGHDAGDRVLKEVAARLMGCVREIDTVARLGGDEFVILIEQVTNARQVTTVAHKLIRIMADSLVLDGHECSITASVGISTYPEDGSDAATLLKNADIAMYRAKARGKNNFQFYAPSMNVHSVQRLALESGLRQALKRDELLLHYQPKVNIASNRVTGMEALVRWQRPEGGMVSPGEFIPLAEETGLIVPIGEWVLKAACEHTQTWHQGGAGALKVAVNLSARQFAQTSLVSDVARVLDMTGLHPEALDLEITESMVMGNPEQAIQTLRRLKSMGISISLDDFGTGYSSLGYLKRFPLDYIKIDRSFIKDIPADTDDATITRTIIAMAHNLRLKVIAEGVETQEQLNFMREHGCDEMQGYFFSRPVPGNEFVALIHKHEARAA